MVPPADIIRELRLTNRHLITQNASLKTDIHNLKVTIDMLKNKAAKDQAIRNAVVTIKNLETYNQHLEDENKQLMKRLLYFEQKKKNDDQLAVLRQQVVEIDRELVKRLDELEIVEELEYGIKVMMREDSVEDKEEDATNVNSETESEDGFTKDTQELSEEVTKEVAKGDVETEPK